MPDCKCPWSWPWTTSARLILCKTYSLLFKVFGSSIQRICALSFLCMHLSNCRLWRCCSRLLAFVFKTWEFVVSVSSLKFTDEPRILSTLFWLNDQCYYFTLHGHSLNPDCTNENNVLFNLCLFVKSAVRHFRLSQSWHCFAFKTAATSRFSPRLAPGFVSKHLNLDIRIILMSSCME